jgi:hypothetical protein
MYWTLQNLKDSENRYKILHYSSIFSAARGYLGLGEQMLPDERRTVIACDHASTSESHHHNEPP